MIRHIDLRDVDWLGIKDCLPLEDSEEDKERRKQLWAYFDPNGNGLLSLAEADLGIRQMGPAMLPVFYSKKAQINAFNTAKSFNPGSNETEDDYIEFSEFHIFLKYLFRNFGYYFIFKSLDTDNDERLKVDDFVSGIVILKMCDSNIYDVKDARKSFLKYDDNGGGIMLFDEFIKFAQDYNLNVEKHYLIQESMRRPRIIYKKHPFLKAGEKRPIHFEKPERPKSAEIIRERKMSQITQPQQEKRVSKQLIHQKEKFSIQTEIQKQYQKIIRKSEKLKIQSNQLDLEFQSSNDLQYLDQIGIKIKEMEDLQTQYTKQILQLKEKQKTKMGSKAQ